MRRIKHLSRVSLGILLFAAGGLLLSSCAGPQILPEGLTPIPTLIPASLPAVEPTVQGSAHAIDSYPAGLPSALTGQQMYAQHCAECHGFDGKGQVPNARDFADVDYMRGETPAEFFAVISEGRGAAPDDMPEFGSLLTSDQRWDVVYYVWRFSTADDTLVTGSGLYSDNCEDCHGPSGRSKILGAADFSDQKFMASRSPSQLYVSVTQGRGSMPAWQARLEQEERWAVLDFIRSFTYDPTVGDSGEDSFVPQSTPVPQKPACADSYLAMVNPFQPDDAATVSAGEALYEENCVRCHGSDGKGVTGLTYVPGDLTSPAISALLIDNAGEAYCRVAEGLGEMPGLKRQLSQEMIWQIVTFAAALGS